MNPFTSILTSLEIIAQMATLIPGGQVPAEWAASALEVAIRVNNLHISLFGQPLDLTTLKDYTPKD